MDKPSLDSFVSSVPTGQTNGGRPSLDTFTAKPYDGTQDINNSAALLGVTNNVNSQLDAQKNPLSGNALGDAMSKGATPGLSTEDISNLKRDHPNVTDQQISDLQQNPNTNYANASDSLTHNETDQALSKGASNVGGFIKDTINGIQKFGTSALAAPIDIVRQLFGKQPLSASYEPAIGSESTKTFQADTQDYKTNVVDQGGGSMGQDLQQVTSPVIAGASLLGGLGENAAGESLAKTAVDKGLSATEKGVNAVSNAASSAKTALINRAETNALDKTTQAVNPDLTGKKLDTAYKQVVTGGREVTPASIFREQGLTADQQTVNLGKRLNDNGIKLTNNPAKDLPILKDALTNTETKLDAALKGNPDVQYNANKPELQTKLDSVKMPQEYTAIKDSKNVFKNVVNFGKKVVQDSEDSIQGIRDARTKFDTQAKTEYPSAYKNGVIDTKTPAGRAIKQVRDTMNEHLYDTAPNGSEIQKLIGQEADIFRATESIAPKAAENQGKNAVQQFAQKHPIITKGAKAAGVGAAGAVGAGGVYEGGKQILGQ